MVSSLRPHRQADRCLCTGDLVPAGCLVGSIAWGGAFDEDIFLLVQSLR